MNLNRFCIIIVLFWTNTLISGTYGQTVNDGQTAKWGDQGDGTYCNPVLPGDYSDIDAIRVSSDYYAISSTFQYSPGLVVLHSKDLVNWEILSHVIEDITVMTPELNWDKMNRYGKGIWAGSIRYGFGINTLDQGF